jgi:alpha-D-ribose 1-methylphosphonate 5-triphosphate synthase subunit PhnG
MTPGRARRREWLAVLAHAPRDALARHAAAIDERGFETLRAPETGLAMLRGRIGNTGDRFNLGEATMTRCVVRHRSAAGDSHAGVGYVLGRDPERALWVARLDALLQHDEHHADLMRDVIAPLSALVQQRRADEAAQTAASRVRFFTLQPEAAAGA